MPLLVGHFYHMVYRFTVSMRARSIKGCCCVPLWNKTTLRMPKNWLSRIKYRYRYMPSEHFSSPRSLTDVTNLKDMGCCALKRTEKRVNFHKIYLVDWRKGRAFSHLRPSCCVTLDLLLSPLPPPPTRSGEETCGNLGRSAGKGSTISKKCRKIPDFYALLWGGTCSPLWAWSPETW